jgi:hypothetical protein
MSKKTSSSSFENCVKHPEALSNKAVAVSNQIRGCTAFAFTFHVAFD